MKKIKLTSINRNKNKFRMKIALVAVSIGAVAIIPTAVKTLNITPQSGNMSSTVGVLDDTNQTTQNEVNGGTTQSTQTTNTDTTHPTQNGVNNEVDTEKEPEIEEVDIDIKDYSFSKKSVSVCNTDFVISEELEKQINKNINNYGGDCSFIAINLNDGMAFGYNVDKAYQTASTIKVAVSLFSFKQMDSGNGSLDELKVYEERFRRGGSGILKNEKSGTKYSLKDLFYYTLNYSDNVAYYMIHDRFYSNSYNEYLKELGCKNLYLYNGARWGYIDARSMALIWQEIYKYKDETELGKHFFELLTNAEYNYMEEGMDHYESAHKSGWTPRETHDSGIVFAEDDYIVVILNNANGNYSAKSQLLKLSGCIEKVIDEYTLYKEQNKEQTIDKQKILVK